MALLPHFFDDFRFTHPHHLPDQHFGLALTPDDLLTMTPAPVSKELHYYRPWRHLPASLEDVGSSIKSDKDKLQINLDVQHFAPEEISVKTSNGYIIVEGKHEEKKDEHGFISRHFVRKYALPKGTTPETVDSTLSSDGVLTITAPKVPEEVKDEKNVAITCTGPVRKGIKDQTETKDAEKKAEQVIAKNS